MENESGGGGVDPMEQAISKLPGSTRARCSRCDTEFASIGSARRHFVRAHESKGKRYKCPMCFKFYRNEVAVQEHLRTKHAVFRRDLKQDSAEMLYPDDDE